MVFGFLLSIGISSKIWIFPPGLSTINGVFNAMGTMFSLLLTYYRALIFYIYGGSYTNCIALQNYPLRTRVHIYFLALNFWLWNRPHYRTGTHQGDLLKNLRNVAVPGTGIPLHIFAMARPLAYLFVFVLYPIFAFISAVHRAVKVSAVKDVTKAQFFCQFFQEQLLAPEDWFTLWRMNSSLASYHSLLSGSKGYRFENKWTFLREGAAAGVPVSPFLDVGELVIKDQNEEGGMGIHFFKNATEGGDWVIQRRLHNSRFINSLLPENAPLSTFRVMTASSQFCGKPIHSLSSIKNSHDYDDKSHEYVQVLSCVFRAGRAGASTDHSSILFDVDCNNGTLSLGTTNDHWYQLGPSKALRCPWLSKHDADEHDGRVIPNFNEMLDMCVRSHHKLLPDVPIVGFDVAVTQSGMWLLEANLSSNFFRGSFDKDLYFSFLDEYLRALEPLARQYSCKE